MTKLISVVPADRIAYKQLDHLQLPKPEHAAQLLLALLQVSIF